MKALRNAIAIVALILLGGGYLASQVALLQGNPSGFAYQIDQLPIRILTALLFVGAIVLALTGRSEAE